jgi:molybdate transport system substrate-binding protein
MGRGFTLRSWQAAAILLALAALPAAAPEAELVIYAAASLEEALNELKPSWQAAVGAGLVIQTAGSNTLARQILAAGRADVFLSADEAWMDRVQQAGLVDDASRRIFLSNQLVVVAPRGTTLQIGAASDLDSAAIRRLSLADPEAVPAGRYARQWLESAGVWGRIQDRVVPAADARAAVAAVESGAVDAGVVYRTDALLSARTRILLSVPEEAGPRIVYIAAALRGPRLDRARRAVSWLDSGAARAAFLRRGFIVPAGQEAGAL